MTDADYSKWIAYANRAADVYNPGDGSQVLLIPERPPETSDFVLHQENFYGRIYRSGSDFIVAIRGTDASGDYDSNIPSALGYGLYDSQFASTVELIKHALKAAGWDGHPVEIYNLH